MLEKERGKNGQKEKRRFFRDFRPVLGETKKNGNGFWKRGRTDGKRGAIGTITALNGLERNEFRQIAFFGDRFSAAQIATITIFSATRSACTRKKSLVFLGFFVGFRWDNDREFKGNCNWEEISRGRVFVPPKWIAENGFEFWLVIENKALVKKTKVTKRILPR